MYYNYNSADWNAIGSAIATYIACIAIFAIVAIALMIIAYWKILTKAGYNGAWSLLVLVPGIGGLASIGILLFLAFSEWPAVHRPPAQAVYVPPTSYPTAPPPGPGYAPPSYSPPPPPMTQAPAPSPVVVPPPAPPVEPPAPPIAETPATPTEAPVESPAPPAEPPVPPAPPAEPPA